METFMAYGETSVGHLHLLVVEAAPGLYRVYASPDGMMYGHCETFEDPRDLCEIMDDVQEGFDTRLFTVHQTTPFTRARVLREAPHAFDACELG